MDPAEAGIPGEPDNLAGVPPSDGEDDTAAGARMKSSVTYIAPEELLTTPTPT